MRSNAAFGFVVAIGVISACIAITIDPPAEVSAAQPATARAQPQPVEPSMHEFMEYVFQPTYKRLKSSMASEPADNNSWKAIKADSLTLAEATNLLLARLPEKDGDSWSELSIAVRDAGSGLYQAAKKKDYKTTRQQYETMLTKCNACHNHFAKGEHQLTP